MDAETKADLRVKVRRRVSEYIQKSGLPLNRTGSGETEAVCPNCGQTAAVKKIPLEEHFEFWKCESCGAEGDAVQYAMHHLRTASEDEALLDVCKKLGVVIPVLPTITAKELIEGMLGPGLYILAGAPKIGKSWLVLQIAHHISTGTPPVGSRGIPACGALSVSGGHPAANPEPSADHLRRRDGGCDLFHRGWASGGWV